jgi:hypothetical protein
LDKIFGILLIAIIAIVSATSLTYYVAVQQNQTQNNPSPTPTLAPEPTPTTTPSPSETPTESSSLPKPAVPEFTVKLTDYDVIEVKIKNQPEQVVDYNIRVRSQFSENWTELYHCPKVQDFYEPDAYPRQSEYDYTVLSFTVDYPAGDQVDIQVEAIIGVWVRPGIATNMFAPWIYDTETSGWSDTQTITIP